MPSNIYYSNSTTINHPLSVQFKECLIAFNDEITKEGKRCNLYDSKWIALDLDAVEIRSAQNEKRSERRSTVDFTVGIEVENSTKMLLVECRFNYKSAKEVKESEVAAKITGSINLLGQSPAIYKTVYFLFNDKVKPEAYRKLREFKANRKEYIAVNLNEFHNLIIIKGV